LGRNNFGFHQKFDFQPTRYQWFVVTNVSADTDAQPLLIHVQDSRRSSTDIDPDKGSEAIIEIYQTNGSVAVEILKSGFNLLNGSTHETWYK
jgi:hypothetical protein